MRRESCLAVVVLMLVGCPANPNVTPNPVPSAERLRGEDCGAAADLYRQQLMVPRRSGTIVSSRLTVRSEQEQAQDLAVFVTKCQGQLVGRARRAIVRCWQDSTDAETFDSCNDRF
jgi:hypothetical protein